MKCYYPPPILHKRDKAIKYLSEYVNPASLVPEPVFLTSVPYYWWDNTWPQGGKRKIQAM